jgi:hypothetical protein
MCLRVSCHLASDVVEKQKIIRVDKTKNEVIMDKKDIKVIDLGQNEYLAFCTYSYWGSAYTCPEVEDRYFIVNSEGKFIKSFLEIDVFSDKREKEIVLPNGEKFLSIDYAYADDLHHGGFCIIEQTQTPLQKAIMIASSAFRAEKDKAGRPYIYHLLYVMGKGQNENEKIVGVLHDLIEDCGNVFNGACFKHYGTERYNDLILKEFGQEIFDAVKCLTKIEGEDYDVYLKKVKNNKLARQVKLYDLEHNMDISRLSNPKQEDYDRLEKYIKSYNYLLTD